MMSEPADLLVIGGGVNGTGIARDAAGRGLSVILAERGDLAGATSSAATKLIHGGLRYLEHYEFRLVREALGERETLLRMAPHIIRSEEHTSELQSLMRISYAVFCLKKTKEAKMLPLHQESNRHTNHEH